MTVAELMALLSAYDPKSQVDIGHLDKTRKPVGANASRRLASQYVSRSGRDDGPSPGYPIAPRCRSTSRSSRALALTEILERAIRSQTDE